jgi:hypothetical protein
MNSYLVPGKFWDTLGDLVLSKALNKKYGTNKVLHFLGHVPEQTI